MSKLLQNLSGNPDCKVLSMCGNPDDFVKSFWKSCKLWQKLGIWTNFIKNNIEMWSKTVFFLEFKSLKLPRKSGIPTSSMGWRGRALFIWRAQYQGMNLRQKISPMSPYWILPGANSLESTRKLSGHESKRSIPDIASYITHSLMKDGVPSENSEVGINFCVWIKS